MKHHIIAYKIKLRFEVGECPSKFRLQGIVRDSRQLGSCSPSMSKRNVRSNVYQHNKPCFLNRYYYRNIAFLYII